MCFISLKKKNNLSNAKITNDYLLCFLNSSSQIPGTHKSLVMLYSTYEIQVRYKCCSCWRVRVCLSRYLANCIQFTILKFFCGHYYHSFHVMIVSENNVMEVCQKLWVPDTKGPWYATGLMWKYPWMGSWYFPQNLLCHLLFFITERWVDYFLHLALWIYCPVCILQKHGVTAHYRREKQTQIFSKITLW